MLLFLECHLGGQNNKVTSDLAYNFHQTSKFETFKEANSGLLIP